MHLVSLEIGGRYTPNLKATEIMLYDGLSAVSCKQPKCDSICVPLSNHYIVLCRPGFYYKTFIKAKGLGKSRRPYSIAFSGFSKAPTEEDVDVYDHIFHHAEVIIIGGGGVAGISAALEVLNNSKTLMEELFWLMNVAQSRWRII